MKSKDQTPYSFIKETFYKKFRELQPDIIKDWEKNEKDMESLFMFYHSTVTKTYTYFKYWDIMSPNIPYKKKFNLLHNLFDLSDMSILKFACDDSFSLIDFLIITAQHNFWETFNALTDKTRELRSGIFESPIDGRKYLINQIVMKKNELIKKGRTEPSRNAVAELLGFAPQSFRDMLKDYKIDFDNPHQ
jgi:hypothetical protein